jgi:hypothetical protein
MLRWALVQMGLRLVVCPAEGHPGEVASAVEDNDA